MLGKLGWGLCAAGAMFVMAQQPASASTAATATMTSQQLSANSWQYSLDLTNTGTTTINTFWNAWIVFDGLYVYDLLPTNPTGVSSPSGWAGGAVNDGVLYSPGYYGIEWQSATGLAPGASLSGFTFTTSDPPSTVNGTSFFDNVPVRESWVYNGASQSEPGLEFTPTIVTPEPATAMLLLPAGLMLAARRKRRGSQMQ